MSNTMTIPAVHVESSIEQSGMPVRVARMLATSIVLALVAVLLVVAGTVLDSNVLIVATIVPVIGACVTGTLAMFRQVF